MSEEILINVIFVEICVVLVENGMLQEVYIECISCKGIVGNIYKGKVVWVLLGMEVVFVDIGLECVVFIYVLDVVFQFGVEDVNDGFKIVLDIWMLLWEGQFLVVQVIKDLIGIKGVWLIIQLFIFFCYLVFMLGVSYVGIFQCIEDENECVCFKGLVDEVVVVEIEVEGGYIIWIVVEVVLLEELIGDMIYLYCFSQLIYECIFWVQVFVVVYQDLLLFICIICDLIWF